MEPKCCVWPARWQLRQESSFALLVHDAILVEGPLEKIDQIAQQTRDIMREASRIVLDGFELATDAEFVRWPDRYMDEQRGRVMWERTIRLAIEQDQSGRNCPTLSAKLADQFGQFVRPVQSY